MIFQRLLGIPLLIAILAGIFFPFPALEYSKYAFLCLFLLMTLSAMNLDFKKLKFKSTDVFDTALTLFLSVFFIPALLWFLLYLCGMEASLLDGAILAAAAPIAIVAPLFVSKRNGDVEFSFLLMILSTLFFPILGAILYFIFSTQSQTLNIKPLVIDTIVLSTIPIILGYIFAKPLQNSKFFYILQKATPAISMILIALLTYIYTGAAYTKFQNNISIINLWLLLGFGLLQDFGVYFLMLYLGKFLFFPERATSVAISLAMKNVALSGGIMLIYAPKAALASTAVFIGHALFFNYLFAVSNRRV